jgi:hypothetical protein
VLIFVESPGSFAETGMFAALRPVAEKTLIVNTRNEGRQNSFLSLGPIRLIRKMSHFDTHLELDAHDVTDADADAIIQSILSNYTKYKKALVFHPAEKFKELNLRLQLACVQMAVALLHAGSVDLVTAILREHFKTVDKETVGRFLSVLTSLNLLEREDEIYFVRSVDPFTDDALISSVGFSVDNVRARALEWQQRNNSQVTVFLRERLGVDI